MFCPKCGNEVQEGSAFCGKCGAPVGDEQRAASSSLGMQAGVAPVAKKYTAKIGIIAAAAVVVVVLIAGFATNWFGLAGVQPKEAVDVPAASQQNPGPSEGEGGDASAEGGDAQQAAGASVKSALEAYTWDELSQISVEIAAAGSEDAAIEVAKRYNLCTPDGKLDGTQVKSVTLSDGTQTTVQIAGFVHDDKTGGGKAGVTFIFGDCIGVSPMNNDSTNAGGWEASVLRASLNGQILGTLPGDLSSVIVPVDKLTNNVGETESVSSVSTTSDKLWLFSATELFGNNDWHGTSFNNAVMNAEGSEYKLFRDMAVDSNNSNPILVKNYEGSSYLWWERSPNPGDSGYFCFVSSGGSADYYATAVHPGGVVPGFCI